MNRDWRRGSALGEVSLEGSFVSKSPKELKEHAQDLSCAASRSPKRERGSGSPWRARLWPFLVVLALGSGPGGCKKADTEAAQGQAVSTSEVRTRHASVGCLQRLSSLVALKPSARPWAELSLEARIGLCRGATSTAPIDCLVNVHDALVRLGGSETAPKALEGSPRLLDFSSRVCAGRAALPTSAPDCLVDRLKAGADLRSAALACRKPPPLAPASALPACVSKFARGTGTPERESPHAQTLAFTPAETRSLCAGAKDPARPMACVEALERVLATEDPANDWKGAALALCRGNDDPNTLSCFQEAKGTTLQNEQNSTTATLTTLQAARLCGALD